MSNNGDVESNILKSVFLVTVNQGDGGFTFLPKYDENY